jgi:pSer/pThr/pTyr-binding forkhead associated (FHA) protein
MTGENANHVETFEECPITLGRDEDCHFKFDKFKDLAVSGKHAQIEEVSEGAWQIANIGKNGVLVNGVPCDTTTKLPNHATIQLGRDGPRIRFDVDQSVGGISKADVERKKEKTQKFRKDAVGRARPATEEHPVYQPADVGASTPNTRNRTIMIAVGTAVAAILAVAGAIIVLR